MRRSIVGWSSSFSALKESMKRNAGVYRQQVVTISGSFSIPFADHHSEVFVNHRLADLPDRKGVFCP